MVTSPRAIQVFGRADSPEQLLKWPRASVMGYRESWSHWFHAQGVQSIPDAACLEFDTTTLAIQSVKQGELALLSRSFLVTDSLARGELVSAHPGTMATSGGHYMVWKKGDQRPKVLAFCDWIRRELAKQNATKAQTLPHQIY